MPSYCGSDTQYLNSTYELTTIMPKMDIYMEARVEVRGDEALLEDEDLLTPAIVRVNLGLHERPV
eukprot:3598157-Pleurochrysis_carterae.AAC.1